MNIFETAGQAQMLLGEGNRQIVMALATGFCKRLQRLARLFGGSPVNLGKSA